MFEILTSFVFCSFTGAVLKALCPCSSFPLFAVSDMDFRVGDERFRLKKNVV